MGNISLTASMRSNLQSLQGIAASQNVVQNRLATGLKVSSAIENPSSFYTAQSLNNRSADLGMLLDSMSQGIQTIKSATQAIDIATKMLEQAKATAVQSMDKAGVAKTVITKNWLIENGVNSRDIVTTKDELITRMNTAQAGDRIVVWGDIDMGNTELTMKDGVKLVGAQYVINQQNLDKSHKVEIANQGKITFNKTTSANGINVGNNTEISDLSLELTTTGKAAEQGLIYNSGKNITLRNLDLKQIDNSGTNLAIGAIYNGGNAVLEGIINIQTSGTGTQNAGIQNSSSSKVTQSADSEINITTSGIFGYGIYSGTNILNGKVNITTSGEKGFGFSYSDNIFNGYVNIITSATHGHGINNGTSTINGTVNITTSGAYGYGVVNRNLTLSSTAKLLIETKNVVTNNFYNAIIKYSSGASVGIKNTITNTDAWWKAEGFAGEKNMGGSGITINTLDGVDGWAKKGTFSDLASIIASITRHSERSEESSHTRNLNSTNLLANSSNKVLDGSAQYSSILAQFNNLIKDAGYKGINLLLEQNLKINFNEDRSANLNIKGVDSTTKGLGLETKDWFTSEDIAKSISELDGAISQLRNYSSEFGNYLSIVSTREDFTSAIINVLTEGADKLTLADMNQESANMLALQTRQQLAVNSLSLASQANQSVLKLF